MALPKLNNTPKYSTIIPSSGKKIKFRPYLVAEEKVLLMAMETKDSATIINAVADTIISCIEGPIDRASLKTFDIESLFVKLRAKSVGESSQVVIPCSHKADGLDGSVCGEANVVTIDLDSIHVDVPANSLSKIIELQPSPRIAIEVAWPSFESVANNEIFHKAGSDTIKAYEMVADMLVAIHTDDERIDLASESRAELHAFIGSMSKPQMEQINLYAQMMPKLTHTIDFNCEKCGAPNHIVLEGMQSFF